MTEAVEQQDGPATEAPEPAHLGPSGQTLWRQIVQRYTLRPDEVRTLEDACREADLIERMETAMRSANLVVHGSHGQQVAHPMASELRQHRAVLAGLFRSLRLPDSPAGHAQKQSKVSQDAAAAARARWSRHNRVTG